MMKTIVVVVAVLALCLIVAEARSRKSHDSGNSDSRKTGDRKQGDRPLPKPLGREVKLCKALVNGNITNDNQTFENVFIAVNTTCTELLDFLVAQNDSVPEDTTGRTKRRAGRGRGSKGRRQPGKKASADSEKSISSESIESDESGSTDERQGDGELGGQTPVKKLLHFCDEVKEFVPTEETSQDLVAIVEKFESPCTTACEIAGGVDCAPLVDGGAQ
ncbi:uncharacterized protein LOC128236391 [Mya arenaria]|uniref:uncharacterized protein LOC128236391 n=1 Tax=Mya arenaria TaxID=6604 RepID=UPI0022E49950|nr:uncharacterized protein LOC128236391 [Mya arenaria]